MARSGLPRWFWPLLGALCVLLLLLQVLLQHSSSGDSSPGDGVAGAGARGRAPFPKGGELSGVRHKPEVEPRENSAADPWQERGKQK